MEKAIDSLQVLLAALGAALIVALPVSLYLIASRTFDEEWALERNWNVSPAGGAELVDSVEAKDGFHGDGVAVYVYETSDSPSWIIPGQIEGVDEDALLTATSIMQQLGEKRDDSQIPDLTTCRWISVRLDRGELIECRSVDPNAFVLVERIV